MGVCPSCNKPYREIKFVNYDGKLIKIYVHSKGEKCKVRITDKIELRTEKTVEKCEVDYREKESNIHNYMDNFVDDVIVKVLEVSDICFPNSNIGVERKYVSDLDASMMDGRLEDQMDRGSKEFDLFFILISGSIREYAYKQSDKGSRDAMTIRKSLNSYIASLQVKTCLLYKNVRLMRLESDIELCHYASRIDNAYIKIKKEIEDSGGRIIVEKIPIQDFLMPVSFNQFRCHPKIGKKKALKLLEEFGNYKDFVNSTTGEKVERSGFSKKFIEEMESDIDDRW